MTRGEILDAAKEIVCKDRNEQYGKPEDNFKVIADMWSAYLGVKIKSVDVCMMMCMLKIARVKTGKVKDDNLIDLAGYAACACEVGEAKQPEAQNELEHCPRCGAEAELHFMGMKYFVQCTSCGAETEKYATWEEAIEVWNRRV